MSAARDMQALRASDPKHYDDRRAHLIELGATDSDIQRFVQLAVDSGISPIEFLADIEKRGSRYPSRTLDEVATDVVRYRRRGWGWFV